MGQKYIFTGNDTGHIWRSLIRSKYGEFFVWTKSSNLLIPTLAQPYLEVPAIDLKSFTIRGISFR